MSTPAPLTPDQQARIHENRGDTVIAVSSTFIGLCTVAVVLRFASRLSRHLKLGVDEYLSVAALASVTAYSVTCILATQWGLGKHVWAVDPQESWKVIRMGYAGTLVSYTSRFLVQMCLLFLYRRVFTLNVAWFRYAWYGMITYCAGVYVGCFFSALLQCLPPSYFWQQFNMTLDPPAEGSCGVNNAALVIGTSCCAIIAEVALFIMPITMLWGLQVTWTRKLALILVFGAGAFAIGAAVTRLVFGISATKLRADTTWITADIFLWTGIESSVGLICACMPTLGPILVSTRNVVSSYMSELSLLPNRSSRGNSGQTSSARWGSGGPQGASARRIAGRNSSSTNSLKPPSFLAPQAILRTDEYSLETQPRTDDASINNYRDPTKTSANV